MQFYYPVKMIKVYKNLNLSTEKMLNGYFPPHYSHPGRIKIVQRRSMGFKNVNRSGEFRKEKLLRKPEF